jgi:transcriptional regulator with AAA-type ATPase domain
MNHNCQTLLKNGMHCLLVGPTGTGKSLGIR